MGACKLYQALLLHTQMQYKLSDLASQTGDVPRLCSPTFCFCTCELYTINLIWFKMFYYLHCIKMILEIYFSKSHGGNLFLFSHHFPCLLFSVRNPHLSTKWGVQNKIPRFIHGGYVPKPSDSIKPYIYYDSSCICILMTKFINSAQ